MPSSMRESIPLPAASDAVGIQPAPTGTRQASWPPAWRHRPRPPTPQPGLTVATFMLRQWLPAKKCEPASEHLGRLPTPDRAARGATPWRASPFGGSRRAAGSALCRAARSAVAETVAAVSTQDRARGPRRPAQGAGRRTPTGPGRPQRRRRRRSSQTPPAERARFGPGMPSNCRRSWQRPDAPTVSCLLAGGQHRHAPVRATRPALGRHRPGRRPTLDQPGTGLGGLRAARLPG